ncbi:hypothetical protein QCA50_014622 [Cerrena zonata]|uniref:Uncharacterized protein n=1 Tax=Cerrena zonata TaxID=2478898 RepID=A0AAW0FQP8_9APHY
MADLYGKFSTWGRDAIDGKEAVAVARKIWSIGEEEGYWSERGRLAADVAWVAAAHSDADAVQEWAALGLEWYAYELGADSEQVREMKDVMVSPKTHPVWGTKHELSVGGPGSLSKKV